MVFGIGCVMDVDGRIIFCSGFVVFVQGWGFGESIFIFEMQVGFFVLGFVVVFVEVGWFCIGVGN